MANTGDLRFVRTETAMRSAFSAWALLGILQRWFDLTDEPVSGMLPYLEDFNAGIQAGATRLPRRRRGLDERVGAPGASTA